MWCSVFENDENVIGWKAGSLVAYCETSKKSEKEMNLEETDERDEKKTCCFDHANCACCSSLTRGNDK